MFAYSLLIEDYQQGALRKEPIMAPFIECFKIATFRKSISARAICITITYLLTFSW